MRLVKTSPNARRGDEAIARLLIGGATTQLGLFWPNPKGCGSFLVNFAFFASQIRLCIFGAKKAKFPQKS
jgi:hypothetical protein